MNFLALSNIGSVFDAVPCSVRTRDRARIFGLIAEGRASSRVEIASMLSLRSTSVSEIVGELIECGLVAEAAHVKDERTKGMRGRPVISLSAKFQRLGVIVVQVVSQSIMGALLDLSGRVIEQRTQEVSRNCDNAEMRDILRGLCTGLTQRMPREMGLASIVLSLPGVLDIPDGKWVFSSRWPKMHALDLREAVAAEKVPVHIVRNLDAEVRGRVTREKENIQSTLLFHWGFGIGSSYAINGIPINHDIGRFGEIGHWMLYPLMDRKCVCGREGCLETAAALWSMLDDLRATWPELPSDEASFAELSPSLDLLSHPRVVEGLDMVVFALRNLCRVLFPRKIIITGPFVANAALWERFTQSFQKDDIITGMIMPELLAERHSHGLERKGAALPLFLQATTDILANPTPV